MYIQRSLLREDEVPRAGVRLVGTGAGQGWGPGEPG
jgi:hypothetical protein